MTLQALYESFVRLTLDDVKYSDDSQSPLVIIANKVSAETPFAEICVLSDLYGANIPHKQDFVKWGETYLIQVLYFLTNSAYVDNLKELFKAINKHKCLQRLINIDFVNACFDIYFDMVVYNHDIARILSEFIIDYCQQYDRYKDFFSVANATGLFSTDKISYLQFLATKPKTVDN